MAELLLYYILMLLICIVTYVVGYIYRNVHVSNCNGPQDYHKRATELKACTLWNIGQLTTKGILSIECCFSFVARKEHITYMEVLIVYMI